MSMLRAQCNRFRYRNLGIAMLTAVVSTLLSTACPASNSEVRHASLVHDGISRTYRLFVPLNLSSSNPAPLVLVLHGGGGNGDKMARLTKFDAAARKYGFIVVYPDAYEKHWNDGRQGTSYTSMDTNVDDVGFLETLIGHIQSQFAIDASRVYITGASNGGMMTYRMLCERTPLFAAAAPVIANMPTDLVGACVPAAPIPMLILNGEEDPLMPWNGGEIAPDFPKRRKVFKGTVVSTEETVAYWSTWNACTSVGEKTYLPDADPNDGTRIWVQSHTGGTDGAVVHLYGVEGGGHGWPGGAQYLVESIIGKVSQDVDATELIWQFFQNHTRE